MFKRTLALAAGFALCFSAVFAHAAEVLKVSAIPDEAPTELLRKFKPLGAYLRGGSRGLGGATVLGSGRVMLVLDVGGVIAGM